MNTISNLRAEETGKGSKVAPVHSAAAEREKLIEEFSSLLSRIGESLENQNRDAIIDMDITVATVPERPVKVRKGAAQDWKDAKEDIQEAKNDILHAKERVKEVKDAVKEDREEVRKAKKEVKEVREEVKEVAKEIKEAVKDAREAAKDEVEEEVPAQPESEAGEQQEALTGSPENVVEESAVETSAAEIAVSEQAAAPLVKKEVEQAKEVSASVEEVKVEEEVAVAAVQADTETSEDAAADTDVQVAASRIEGQEQPGSDGEAEPLVRQASENAKSKEQKETAPKSAKAAIEILQASPEVQAAEEAIKNILADRLSPDKAAAKSVIVGLDRTFIQPVDTQSKVTAPSPSASLAMNFVKEVAGITLTTNSGNNGHPLSGFGNASRGNEAGSQQHSAKTEQMPRGMQARTIERIEDALKEVAKSKDGKTISFRLDPPELGSVKIDVSCKEGTLHAKLVSESQQVTQLIRDKAFDLQGVLRKLGLPFERVVVSVGQEQPQQNSTGQSFSSDAHNAGERQSNGGNLSNRLADMFPDMSEQSFNRGSKVRDDHWIA